MVIYLLQSKFKKPDKERVLMFLLFDKIISTNYLSTKYLFDKKIVDQKLSTKICRPKFVDQILSTKVLADKNLSTNDMITSVLIGKLYYERTPANKACFWPKKLRSETHIFRISITF